MAQSKFVSILLNHKLFVGMVAAFGVFVVGLLIYMQFFMPLPQASELVLYPLTRPTVNFPLEINVVKGDFNLQQQKVLNSCVNNWKEKSNGVVDIKLNMDWNAPKPFSEINYLNFGQKTLWMRDSNDPEVLMLKLKSSMIADGVSKGDFIMVINDKNEVDLDKLYIIVLHEISHQLGLEHIKPEYPALMNLGGNNGVITKYDLVVLCSLYKCKE
ncbi:MAG: hypothetical protein Q7R95_06545 [bacterium]|nr:hypothetical protein [bacterium]